MKRGPLAKFKKEVWGFYRANKREMPWRTRRDPYAVLVSEVMLQQTQVSRVIPKFEAFLKKFPSFESLAKADVSELLLAWQGLGYNRRALALRRAAEIIASRYGGTLPKSVALIDELPGVGQATAAAVYVYTWNLPAVFLETNVRTVFIHFFFRKSQNVSDAAIERLVGNTLDADRPREWYYALMDYGAMLKRSVGNASRQSARYAKQTAFRGSRREVRGKILKAVLGTKKISLAEIKKKVGKARHDVSAVLGSLEREGFIQRKGANYAAAGPIIHDKKVSKNN